MICSRLLLNMPRRCQRQGLHDRTRHRLLRRTSQQLMMEMYEVDAEASLHGTSLNSKCCTVH